MTNSNGLNESHKLVETKDLVFVWRLLLRNIGFLIFIPLFAYLVGYIYTYQLTEVHGVKVQLLLKSNETYDYQDQIYQGLGAYGAYMDVQNQIRILHSRDLIGEIIDKIDVGVSYYFIGRIRKKEVFETLPYKANVEVVNNNVYEIPISLNIIDKETYELRYEVDGVEKSWVYPFDSLVINKDFKLNVKKKYDFSENNLGKLLDSDYELIFHSKRFLINKYRSGLSIENVEYTSIIEVQIEDEIKSRGKRFLDTLTSVYIDYSKRIQLEVNYNTISNIEKQLDTISKFIKSKEEELLTFKDKNAILNLPKEEDDYFKKYVENTNLKREFELKMSSLKALESYVLSLDDEHFLPPTFSSLSNDLYLNQTIKKVYELQLELSSKSSSLLESNANIVNLKNEINSLKRDVLIYIENLSNATKKELIVLNDYINKNKSKIRKIPVSEQGVANIKRELEVNNKMYLYLLEKKTNSLIARAGIIPQVRLVETAAYGGIVRPNKSKIIKLYVLGGLLFAFLIALIRKLFFERIENVSELTEEASLTVIGGLPLIKEVESKLIVTKKPKAQITESFRTLRTNLSYLGSLQKTDGKAKKIIISSFFPGEGKTFTSTNLSSLMAMSDKKVIIVDFDLHKPKIHKSFDLDNKIGISSYLIGQKTLDEVIRKNVANNLDVVTVGPIPPNPSELILKSKMDDLFEELEKEYDYILIDTPPFGLLNDSLELLKYMDVFIVVLNTKYIRRKGLKKIESLVSMHEGVSVGLVLNGVKKTKFQYYYSKYSYKYNYNYGYNYGYGYGDSYSDYVDKED